MTADLQAAESDAAALATAVLRARRAVVHAAIRMIARRDDASRAAFERLVAQERRLRAALDAALGDDPRA